MSARRPRSLWLAALALCAHGAAAHAETRPGLAPAAQAQARRYITLRNDELVQRQTALGRRLLSRGQHAQAADALATAYAFAPHPELLYQLAGCLHKSEHPGDALVLYQVLLEIDPRSPHRPEVEAKMATLRAVAELQGEAPDRAQAVRAYRDRGNRSFRERNFADAIAAFSTAYALKRLSPLLFNIAQAHRRANRLEEAYLMYDRLLLEDPTTPVRSEAEGYLSELRPAFVKPPLYRRPWLWGAIGAGVVLAGTAIGLSVGLQPRDPVTDGGHVDITLSLRGLP